MTTSQTRLAERLRSLHRRGNPLILPNAWDAASARAVVDAGFGAVATTSGGVAASLGFSDGELTPPDEMFAAIARIVRAVDVPVTADIEAGYGLSPDELAGALVDAGAAGCNLEDTDHAAGKVLGSSDRQADRIARVKDAASAAGADLVVNARIDVFVREAGEPAERVDLALARARQYQMAGADCVYPIAADEDALAQFTSRFDGEVNGMVRPSAVRYSRLLALPLARISFASALHRFAMRDLTRRLTAIRASDDDWFA